MLVYYNKRVNLQINEVLFPEDLFGTPMWLLFLYFVSP